MKNTSLKITVFLSIFLNIVLIVLFVNRSIEIHTSYSTGDPGAYRNFISSLGIYEKYLEETAQQSAYNEIMNSLVNGNERLKRSIHSFAEFRNSLNETNLNTQYIEDALAEIDEITSHLLANYSIKSYQVDEEISHLKKSVNRLLNLLPKQYDVDNQQEFIKTINTLSGSN